MDELTWTETDTNYLLDNWGSKSIMAISKNLNRSAAAILNKKKRLGLGSFLENGDYVTINQFFIAIGRPSGISYTLQQWEKKGLPVKRKKVMHNSFKIIYLEGF